MASEEDNSVDIPSLPPKVLGRSSLRVFFTTLRAFLLRELKGQFGRSRLGYFWAIAEPAGLVAVLTLLHAVIRGRHATLYGESPVVFFAFGAVAYFLFANNVNDAQGVCRSNRGLFNYPQVRPVDIILARCIIDALMMSGVGLAFLVGWWWLGRGWALDDPLLLVFALTSLFLMGFCLGLVFEVFGTVFPDMQRIFSLIMRPMLFISGLFFSIEMIPLQYRFVLIWNPVLHGVDLTRDAVIVGYTSPANPVYMWVCILVMLFISLAAYRRYLYRLI